MSVRAATQETPRGTPPLPGPLANQSGLTLAPPPQKGFQFLPWQRGSRMIGKGSLLSLGLVLGWGLSILTLVEVSVALLAFLEARSFWP